MIQTAVGDYRQKILEELVRISSGDFFILAGPEYFESSTKTKVFLPEHLKLVRNIFLLNRKFLFQVGITRAALRADCLILEMNPRIINNWFILLARKLLGKKSVLWGHAWPRAGRNSKSDKLRNILRNLADCILVYTESQRIELIEKMPGKLIIAAPNSLYSKNDMYAGRGVRSNFIYVGRLVKSKKPELLLKGFSDFLKHNSNFPGKLIIIGEGPELVNLENLSKQLDISNYVSFEGHISDINVLRSFYSNAICSVSPGYVGLSITQSFSFGTPMLISKTEAHAPEIEAAVDGVNCLFFETDSVADLSKNLSDFYLHSEKWGERQDDILERCRTSYSAEHMANRIHQAFLSCNT